MKKWDILTLLVSTVIALALANMVFTRMPRLYNASTLVSDETQEMTIAIGLSSYLDREDESKLDDPEVYDRILDSPDFINAICRIPIGRKTYGTHLAEQLGQASSLPIAVDDFRHYVKHAENRKARTIEISVFDRNPNVAALIADSIIARLQQHIRTKKTTVLVANERHLNDECLKAHAEAERARTAYSDYYDSHRDAVAKPVVTEIDRLKKASELAYKNYCTMTEKHLRARFLLQQSEPSFTIVRGATVPLQPTSPQPFVVFGAALAIGLVIGWWACLLRHRIILADWHFSLGGWFAPWSITLLVWAAILVLIRLEGHLLYPLTSQFYTALALWVPTLCVTAFITFTLMEEKSAGSATLCSTKNSGPKLEANSIIFNGLLALSLIMTPLYAWNVYRVVSQFSSADMMNNVRLLANEGGGQGVLAYSVVINQLLLIVALWRYPRILTWQLVVVIASCLMGALAIMEKGAIFFVLLMCFYIMYERRVVKMSTIVALAIVTLSGFYLFNLARQGENSDYAQNETFADFIAMYLASPAVAFSRLSADLTPQIGANTFEFFYAVLDKFGIGRFEVHQKLQDFVWVPMPTNVYTVMQPFFIDFGYSGVAFFGALYGVIFGWLYRLYRNGKGTACVLYTYAIFILVLQFYQDNFMLSLSYIIQLTVLTVILIPNRLRFTL